MLKVWIFTITLLYLYWPASYYNILAKIPHKQVLKNIVECKKHVLNSFKDSTYSPLTTVVSQGWEDNAFVVV